MKEVAVELGNDWDELLGDEFSKEYYLTLRQFLIGEYRQRTIYPNMYKIFEALKRTSYTTPRWCCWGRIPTMAQGRPMAWLFSAKGHGTSALLQNIFKELARSGHTVPTHGCLEPGGSGVLLLNTTLTVRQGQAGSIRVKAGKVYRSGAGLLNQKATPVVFLLWGGSAE